MSPLRNRALNNNRIYVVELTSEFGVLDKQTKMRKRQGAELTSTAFRPGCCSLARKLVFAKCQLECTGAGGGTWSPGPWEIHCTHRSGQPGITPSLGINTVTEDYGPIHAPYILLLYFPM